MDDPTRLNLSESLRSTAIDLNEAAEVVPNLGDDPEEIRIQAEILDRIGDDAREAAAILRNSVAARRVAALPPRRIPPDRPGTHRTPHDAS
jgi:hypothetical protein